MLFMGVCSAIKKENTSDLSGTVACYYHFCSDTSFISVHNCIMWLLFEYTGCCRMSLHFKSPSQRPRQFSRSRGVCVCVCVCMCIYIYIYIYIYIPYGWHTSPRWDGGCRRLEDLSKFKTLSTPCSQCAGSIRSRNCRRQRFSKRACVSAIFVA